MDYQPEHLVEYLRWDISDIKKNLNKNNFYSKYVVSEKKNMILLIRQIFPFDMFFNKKTSLNFFFFKFSAVKYYVIIGIFFLIILTY